MTQAPGRCAFACDFAPSELAPSYVCTGSCGERAVFGVSVVLGPRDVPANACRSFRDELLRIFGPGGPRRLPGPAPEPLDDPSYDTGPDGIRRPRPMPPLEPEVNEGLGFSPREGLGRNPRARVDDQQALAAFERMRRGEPG